MDRDRNANETAMVTWRSTPSTCLLSTAVVLSVMALFAPKAASGAFGTKPKAELRPVKITISKETTYLTGPLASDGWLDYAPVINERCKTGVTVENNAAILFWQAVGPKEIPKEMRAAFFQGLGLDAPADEGDYLIGLHACLLRRKGGMQTSTPEFARWEAQVYDQSPIAESRPWSGTEFPALAGWLDVNQKPLERLSACAKRSKFFEPLIVKANGSMWDSHTTPELDGMRNAVELFRLRAMRRVADGNVRDARDDLLTCHRLARLEGQKPFQVNTLLALVFDQRAYDGDAALIQSAGRTPEELLQCRRGLSELPAAITLGSSILGERLVALDHLRYVARGDPFALSLCGGILVKDDLKEARGKLLADRRIDWDLVFRAYNTRYDAIEKILKQTDAFQRREALKQLEETAGAEAQRVNDPAALARLLSPQSTSAEISRQLARTLLGSGGYSLLAVSAAATAAKSQLADFAIALALYHDDHKAYPPSLVELSPRYISEIPRDPFSNRDYIYQLREGGYLLYSVGRNGRDDRGENWADNTKKYENTEFDKRPDDLYIRSPKEKP
jgi:hypothetical protein